MITEFMYTTEHNFIEGKFVLVDAQNSSRGVEVELQLFFVFALGVMKYSTNVLAAFSS